MCPIPPMRADVKNDHDTVCFVTRTFQLLLNIGK